MSIPASLGPEHLVRAVRVVSGIHGLPAVPTQDWCVAAAACYRALRPGALIAVTIADFEGDGRVGGIEACGLVNGATGVVIDWQRIHHEHASSFGWWLGGGYGADEARSSTLGALPEREQWPRTEIGRRWAGLGVADLLVGIIGMGQPGPGRSLVVELGVPREARPLDDGDAAAPETGATTIRSGEEGWFGWGPGVEKKILHVDRAAGFESYLLRMAAGARLPAHDHGATEECLMLEGEIAIGDLRLAAGDYHVVAAGTGHPEIISETGAVAYLRTEIRAHSR